MRRPGVHRVGSQVSAFVLVLVAVAPFARADAAGPRYELSIGYELPRDANLAREAQGKEADAIEERNTADQACRPESLAACRREDELAFRKRVAAINQVKFWLAFKRCVGSQCEAHVHDVFQLHPGEETRPEIDARMGRISQAGRYAGIGLYADTACTVHRDSDDAVVSFPSADEICRYQVDRMTNAIRRGDSKSLRAVLAEGVSPDQTDDWGAFPIQVAAIENDVEATRILLQAGADQSLPASHSDASPIYLAAEHGNLDVARVLLADGGNSTHAVEVAARDGNLAMARLLVEHHQPLGEALSVAAAFGHPKIVRLLLDNGADPHHGAMLPFLAACRRSAGSYGFQGMEIPPRISDRELAQSSPSSAANSTWPKSPPPDYAAVLAQLLGTWSDIDADPASGSTPLILAVMGGNFEAVKFLVRHHAHVNKPRAGDGKRPLDFVLLPRDAKIARFLRAHGARRSQ